MIALPLVVFGGLWSENAFSQFRDILFSRIFFSAMLQNTIHHFGATTELIRIYSWSIAGTQESSLI